ncbi:MAG TPA: hypothetical protein VFJ19_13030 [Nocardioidaceae bacterium]|nr:hypothetical protein [Nocardioidaceae bacterium]
MPLKRAWNSVETGPGPLRTARGAGRFDDLAVERPLAGLLRVWLPDDRDVDPERGDFRFRDAGGEDVRVAMMTI